MVKNLLQIIGAAIVMAIIPAFLVTYPHFMYHSK